MEKKKNWVLRNVQISRGSSIAANSGAKRRNDPNHYENQGCHQEPHVDFSSICNVKRTQTILKFGEFELGYQGLNKAQKLNLEKNEPNARSHEMENLRGLFG